MLIMSVSEHITEHATSVCVFHTLNFREYTVKIQRHEDEFVPFYKENKENMIIKVNSTAKDRDRFSGNKTFPQTTNTFKELLLTGIVVK